MWRHVPLTLVAGVVIIALCEGLLYVDVQHRGGLVIPTQAVLPQPETAVQHAGRWVAVNMTALCWVGYLLVFEGLLEALSRKRQLPGISSIRARPNRFIVAWLTSIPVWCVFDWINFYYMDAWRYHGLPPQFGQRVVGYFIAFAAISPGMFLAAQLYQHLGLRRIRTLAPPGASRDHPAAWCLTVGVPALLATIITIVVLAQPIPWETQYAMLILGGCLLGACVAVFAVCRGIFITSLAIGAAFTAWAVLVRNPLGNLALWVGLIYLLDPINRWLGAPSLLDDWRSGRWGRTLALFAGGATCGFCWEFWNYWALAKWTYHLPFLGGMERYRYFEMPWLGFLGFLPFAAECWVMLNTIIAVMQRCGLRVAEPLPDADAIM